VKPVEVDQFETGGDTASRELGVLDASCGAAVIAIIPFAVDHHTDLLFEGEIAGRWFVDEFAEHLGHGAQAERDQFFDGFLLDHCGVSLSK